ncbi:MAG: PAS domain S-box protein, partial [Acetobacteraceae bacterium]|nr:PAS domain S-box protein [Acetobacteraceae bacterium]
MVDHAGIVWVGTQSGLNRFDPRTRTFVAYYQRDGLPNNAVTGILEDQRGNLWLTTNNGLSRFDPRTNEFHNYYASDGLAANEIYSIKAFKSRNGEMFLCSNGGLTTFYPDQVTNNPYLPPVVLTDFQLFGKAVSIGGNSPLPESISLTRSLTLTHEQSIFSFGFSSLSYTNPERNRYRYRLEPLETEWNETNSSRRYASYTTLPPGDYVFRVQGSNNRGLWNEEGTSLQIHIEPPWWSTWWFRTLCAALLLLVAGSSYALRVRAITQHNRELIRQVNERTRDLREQVAERQQAEEALRRANHRLEVALRGSNIGIWEAAVPDGVLGNSRMHAVNFWEQLGFDGSDLPTHYASASARVHPEDRERVARAFEAYLSGETPDLEIEDRIQHQDGSYRWMMVRGVAERDPAGRPIRFVGSSTDITEHKRAEEALRESEERFRGTFENAAVGIAHVDPSGRWLRVNGKLAAILGYTVEEALRLGWQKVTFPADMPMTREYWTALFQGQRPSHPLEKRYIRKDGSVIWGQLDASLQRDAMGQPAYAIAMIQDISERKRLDAELRQAKAAAEAANRAKDEFLANVSHEIRTPMNAILGMTDLVLDTELTPDQRQCLQTVKSAADNLLGLLNDLLDFSKIEAGKLELDVADFRLRAVVGNTLQALAVRAHKKGLELVCQVQADVPDALIGDAGRLRQVLLNLVGNAIKFTDQGEVVVRIEAAADLAPEGQVGLRFTVQDTGIGIPPEQQERIFRAFEQEDTSTTRKYGGTGLGLTIASRLVALMGGQISVDSVPGRGSTFAFTASFGQQPHTPELGASPPPVSLRNLRVLVVDDNATNRHILEEWLRGWQMQPTAVGDGLAA